jgi:hypothetical protein
MRTTPSRALLGFGTPDLLNPERRGVHVGWKWSYYDSYYSEVRRGDADELEVTRSEWRALQGSNMLTPRVARRGMS